MIQRIQTVFLILASALSAGTFGLPFATTEEAVAQSDLFADATYSVMDKPIMIGAVAIAIVVWLVAIFLFNNRKLQMNVGLAGIIILSFAIGFGGMEFYNDSAKAVAQPAVGIALPILAIIFAILAMNNIKKDEKLVRSVDRLR